MPYTVVFSSSLFLLGMIFLLMNWYYMKFLWGYCLVRWIGLWLVMLQMDATWNRTVCIG